MIGEVVSKLSHAGVALVLLPKLFKSGLRGCTSLISPSRALIVHSLKFRSYSHFWLILVHEIAHLMLRHVSEVGQVLEDYETFEENEQERDADEWAWDTLYSLNHYREFIS